MGSGGASGSCPHMRLGSPFPRPQLSFTDSNRTYFVSATQRKIPHWQTSWPPSHKKSQNVVAAIVDKCNKLDKNSLHEHSLLGRYSYSSALGNSN